VINCRYGPFCEKSMDFLKKEMRLALNIGQVHASSDAMRRVVRRQLDPIRSASRFPVTGLPGGCFGIGVWAGFIYIFCQ